MNAICTVAALNLQEIAIEHAVARNILEKSYAMDSRVACDISKRSSFVYREAHW